LVSILNFSEIDVEIREKAGRLLHLAPHNHKITLALRQGEAVPSMINMLRHETSEEVQLVLLRVLSGVCEDYLCARRIWETDATGTLIKILLSETPGVLLTDAYVIYHMLRSHQGAREDFREQAGIKPLSALLKFGNDPIKAKACAALTEACRKTPGSGIVFCSDPHSIVNVVASLKSPDEDLQYNAEGVIWHSTRGSIHQYSRKAAWVNKSMLYGIMPLYYASKNEAIQYAAKMIVRDFAKDFPEEVRSSKMQYCHEHGIEYTDDDGINPLALLLVPFLYPYEWVKAHFPDLHRFFRRDRGGAYQGNSAARLDLDLEHNDQLKREYVNTELDTENAQFIVPLKSSHQTLHQDKATRELDVSVDIFGTKRNQKKEARPQSKRFSVGFVAPPVGQRVDITPNTARSAQNNL